MIIIDYFVYKFYNLFLNKTFFGKPLHAWEAASALFTALLMFNLFTTFIHYGYPVWEEKIRYSILAGFVISTFFLLYHYNKNDRIKKVYEKFKNESKFWKITGWVIICIYVTASFFFMGYH